MQRIEAKKVLIIIVTILSLSMMYGCAGLDRAPKNRIPGYSHYHKPLPEADQVLEEARNAGKDKECPAEFDMVKAKVDKAYEIYMACNTKEAIKMAQEAIDETRALCPPRSKSQPKTAAKAAQKPASKAETRPAPGNVILEDIHFDFNKAALSPVAVEILKKNIKTMKENPGIRVQIEGHACAHGAVKYNRSLSERRASAVREYLVKGGISADRLTTIAYGNTRLAVPEIPTPENKKSNEAKINRRVHFEVITK